MMTKSAQTVFFFAFYLFLVGAVLVLAPGVMLGLVALPPTTDVWIRVVGMLTLLIGVYYVVIARHNFLPGLEATVKCRLAVPVFLAAFVAFRLAPPVLLVFGAIDLVGALWTHFAIRNEVGGARAPAQSPTS